MKKVKIFNNHNIHDLEKEVNSFLSQLGGQIQETERLINVSPERGLIIVIFYVDRS